MGERGPSASASGFGTGVGAGALACAGAGALRTVAGACASSARNRPNSSWSAARNCFSSASASRSAATCSESTARSSPDLSPARPRTSATIAISPTTAIANRIWSISKPPERTRGTQRGESGFPTCSLSVSSLDLVVENERNLSEANVADCEAPAWGIDHHAHAERIVVGLLVRWVHRQDDPARTQSAAGVAELAAAADAVAAGLLLGIPGPAGTELDECWHTMPPRRNPRGLVFCSPSSTGRGREWPASSDRFRDRAPGASEPLLLMPKARPRPLRRAVAPADLPTVPVRGDCEESPHDQPRSDKSFACGALSCALGSDSGALLNPRVQGSSP